MPRGVGILLASGLLVACLARAGGPTAEVLEHKGQWESGYGETWYNVVGRLKNTGSTSVRFVKLRIDALDAQGKVVATTTTYNETAEALTVPDVDPKAILATGKVKPLPAGAEQRFRGSFLKDETPPFATYRVTVEETPPVP